MTTTVTQQHWDADADAADDEDCFFESLDRVPSSISIGLDVASSASESDEDDDVRVSFASAVGPPSCFRKTKLDFADGRGGEGGGGGGGYDYGIWMAEPMSIQERRRLLLHGMGLTSSKNLRRDPSRAIARGHSSLGIQQQPQQQQQQQQEPPPPPPPQQQQQTSSSPTPSTPLSVPRSRSYNWTAPSSLHSALLRSYSEPPSLWDRLGDHPRGGSANGDGGGGSCGAGDGDDGRGALSSRPLGLCRIKNLDTGKEFVVSELRKDGSWSRLNDLQTGHQLTVEEFEKGLGYSSIVKEVMRRVNLGTSGGSNGTLKQPRSAKSSSKSRIGSHRKKGGWLKNIMSATGLMSDKDKGVSAKASSSPPSTTSSSSSELMKVRQHGKPYKELTGLYMCQEIQAHRGSIWTIKFSSDARYLASAGEDRIVHVWQALERCTSAAPSLSSSSSSLARSDMSHQPSQHPDGSPDRPPGLASEPSKRTRKGLVPFGSARRSLPDNIVMPGTIFSLSDKPLCSFHGHLDDVLDLSWSKSQHLLSSSMDKTVRLWDVETKTCLKLFAHNDYVTCIQFNPVDDEYFISGSLDAKVRIWSISDRQVVDWCDLHEMVTAACYTPDGQGAFVGSHKGTCRFYNTSDGRLCQEGQIDIRTKKKKSNAKKVTGFQFAPDNASEVLITSADSQIRVFDGFDMIHKFRGFRNTSSQISASFTSDGKYVVCASEDSNVYIWKTQVRNVGSGGRSKGWVTTRSHEHFPCRDISVAIPWPGSGGGNHRPATLAGGQTDANNNQHPSLRCSDSQRSTSMGEDVFHSSTSLKCPPPLPKKGSMTEHTLPCADDLGCPSRSGSGMGSPSASPSLQPGALVPASTPSSSSSSSSWGWYGGSTNKASSCSEEASAWGLVIVTAGLGGDIRVYRNFGLPVRLSRQTNLF